MKPTRSFGTLKMKLETDIAEKVQPLLQNFEADTGVSCCDVDIEMMDVTRIGEERKHYVIAKVKVFID